jgi:hypothetical protein
MCRCCCRWETPHLMFSVCISIPRTNIAVRASHTHFKSMSTPSAPCLQYACRIRVLPRRPRPAGPCAAANSKSCAYVPMFCWRLPPVTHGPHQPRFCPPYGTRAWLPPWFLDSRTFFPIFGTFFLAFGLAPVFMRAIPLAEGVVRRQTRRRSGSGTRGRACNLLPGDLGIPPLGTRTEADASGVRRRAR